MRIHLVTVGHKPPAWVSQAWHEYARRLPRECSMHLIEIAAERRHKNANIERLVEAEGKRLLGAVPQGALVIALDERGQDWRTRQLATSMRNWLQDGDDVALLIGGPDGLSQACFDRARHSWSVSRLTLPHALVRIVVVEQIYRAWSLNTNHPYHRD